MDLHTSITQMLCVIIWDTQMNDATGCHSIESISINDTTIHSATRYVCVCVSDRTLVNWISEPEQITSEAWEKICQRERVRRTTANSVDELRTQLHQSLARTQLLWECYPVQLPGANEWEAISARRIMWMIMITIGVNAEQRQSRSISENSLTDRTQADQ